MLCSQNYPAKYIYEPWTASLADQKVCKAGRGFNRVLQWAGHAQIVILPAGLGLYYWQGLSKPNCGPHTTVEGKYGVPPTTFRHHNYHRVSSSDKLRTGHCCRWYHCDVLWWYIGENEGGIQQCQYSRRCESCCEKASGQKTENSSIERAMCRRCGSIVLCSSHVIGTGIRCFGG